MSSRRRDRRARLRPTGLQDHEREILLRGYDLFEHTALVRVDDIQPVKSPMKESDQELRSLWRKHRAELMVAPELAPGARPHAFFKYDLAIDPPLHWWQAIPILLGRGLISREEELGIERTHDVLSPTNQTRGPSFEDKEDIRRMRLSVTVLWHMQSEFRFAAEWHRRRGRLELADRYELRATVIESYLSEERYEATTDRGW